MTKFNPDDFALAPIPRAPKPDRAELTRQQTRVLNTLTSKWQATSVVARRMRLSQSATGQHLGKLRNMKRAESRNVAGNFNNEMEWRAKE